MYNKEINRKLIFFLMVVLAISLTSLGIRLPSATGISSSGKPKPRPRAVIKNQIKTCKQIIKKVPLADAVIGVESLPYPPLATTPLQATLDCRNSFVFAAQTLSRASPQLS